MLLREAVAVYCENHTEHTDAQNAELLNVRTAGMASFLPSQKSVTQQVHAHLTRHLTESQYHLHSKS
jgi:hypothetical protein